MIEGMIAVMNYLADLPNWVKTGFGAFTVGAIIVGGLLMVIGQVFLGIVGIMSLFELIGVAGMASIKGAVKGLIDELIILTTTTNGLLALSIVGGIILAIMWIWKLKEEMGGWGEFFKSVARGILNVWVVVMSAIGTAVQIALTPVLMMLQTIIDAYNWIAKKAGLSTFDMKVYNPNASIKDLWGDNVGRMSTLVSPIYDFLAPTQVKKEDMASQIMATRDEIMKTQGGVMSNTTSTNTSTVNNFNFDTVQVGDPDKFVTELLDKANTAQNKIYGSTSN
jgi:hypothetical protein